MPSDGSTLGFFARETQTIILEKRKASSKHPTIDHSVDVYERVRQTI
jgi:hypothetical protein